MSFKEKHFLEFPAAWSSGITAVLGKRDFNICVLHGTLCNTKSKTTDSGKCFHFDSTLRRDISICIVFSAYRSAAPGEAKAAASCTGMPGRQHRSELKHSHSYSHSCSTKH